MSKIITLSKGQVTIVDNSDFEWLSQWVWCIHSGGYAIRNQWHADKPRCKANKTIMLHREILNVLPGLEVDHVNGDKLDNRRKNLRVCTHAQNRQNTKKPKTNTSGLKGVSWHRVANKWGARIQKSGKNYHIGLYGTKEEAGAAYEIRARQYFGEFNRG